MPKLFQYKSRIQKVGLRYCICSKKIKTCLLLAMDETKTFYFAKIYETKINSILIPK